MNSDKHIIIPGWSIRGWYWEEHLSKRFSKPSKGNWLSICKKNFDYFMSYLFKRNNDKS